MRIIYLFLIFLFSNLNIQAQAPGCHPDYDALMSIYNNTNGANWTYNSGWGSDCEVCDWYGVICSGNRVEKLILSYNQVSGAIPEELGNLNNLKQ